MMKFGFYLILLIGLTSCRTPSPAAVEQTSEPAAQKSEQPLEQEEVLEAQGQIPELPLLDCREGFYVTNITKDGSNASMPACEAKCVPRREIDCTQTKGCKERGLCSVISQDAYWKTGEYLCTDWMDTICGAVKDQDCFDSDRCKNEGFCTAGSFDSYFNKCGSEDEADCFEPVTNVCMVSASACAASVECKSKGDCGVQSMHWGDTCRPQLEVDCAQSDNCRLLGDCGLVVESGSWCAPTQNSHCEQSANCTKENRCVFKDGMCVE